MSERPSTWLRNQRKHFVKCADCGCQTLPQNAATERPWTAAAMLHITGRGNDGALCFTCANKRREMIGLPEERETDSGAAKGKGDDRVFADASAATAKKICINRQEYTWTVDTVESLLLKWREQQSYEMYKNMDVSWALVVLNNRLIPAVNLSSVAISDGDDILIVPGRGRYR